MQPSETLILFAHGAGAPSSSPWMKAWARRLAVLGKVVAFDYPYMRAGRKAPDRLPKLIAAHREALAAARRRGRRLRRTVLAGKSMGARVGCHLSLEEDVDAVLCLGYPLRGVNGKLRDEVLREMTAPTLLVAGTRDPLCPPPELARLRKCLKQEHAVHVVEAGNHSLEITAKRRKDEGVSQDDVDAETLAAISAFLRDI